MNWVLMMEDQPAKMLDTLYQSRQKRVRSKEANLVHNCVAKEPKLGEKRKNRLREYMRADSSDRQMEGILD